MAKPAKAASNNKRQGAYTAKPSTSYSKTTKPSTPPAPFTKAPSSLSQFLAPLSPKHVYLVHLDNHPQKHKRQIFLLPLFLNIAILALILLRVYTGYPTYIDLLALILGHESPARVNTSSASWTYLLTTLLRRTLTFLLDYLLLAILLPWPVRFVLGPAHWRRKLGFQGCEVIVRKSRASWSDELKPLSWIREDDETIKTRVIPAVTPQRLLKTGYLLIDADWDLDFAAMVKAHELVAEGALAVDDFKTAVLVHGGGAEGNDGLQWLIWRVDEEKRGGAPGKQPDGGRLSNTQRDKIIMFHEKLASMGKEDLFFRWVELIQYESTQPGGFTPERQQKTMKETQQLFEDQGVDFEKFWADVGGMEGIDM
ncbi:hypothetical protein BDBG_06278 [Blastomyces gilchristii SLH14081]|uniref:Uncharacterized protein n=1 Tax=Blastomyces gilchristii (strain SLH14081) TaxID=559298 RepID=A0A179UT84_BLAGS|nr:uncharacterized protein BDBG_06278 [Blastomyces gilchristii SLH14081]OAT10439.1 hypothetical protein BDBG_06278 [Blastomyces gilchristii SLH14081]